MPNIISPLPFTITNGTTADATQVQNDLSQIVSNVNANAAENGANTSITSLAGLTTALTILQGGTGGTTAAGARAALGVAASGPIASSGITGAAVAGPIGASGITGAALAGALGASGITGAAASGANSDITSLAALSTAITIAQGGTGQTSAAAALAALGGLGVSSLNLAAKGHIAFANGLKIQWGTKSMGAATDTDTFDIAFATACYAVVVAGGQTSGTYYQVHTSGYSTSGFTLYSNSGAVSVHWIAVGN